MGVKSSDVAEPDAVTGLVDVKTWLVQAASLNRRKVTEPVGSTAPTRLAVSRTGVPTGPPGEGAARRLGVRRSTVMVKVWHAVVVPLVAQTVVGPNVPAAVGTPVRKPVELRLSPGGSEPLVTEKVGSGVIGLAWNWWR